MWYKKTDSFYHKLIQRPEKSFYHLLVSIVRVLLDILYRIIRSISFLLLIPLDRYCIIRGSPSTETCYACRCQLSLHFSWISCFVGLPSWFPYVVGGIGGAVALLLLIVISVAIYKRTSATPKDMWVSKVRNPSTQKSLKRPLGDDAAQFVNPS